MTTKQKKLKPWREVNTITNWEFAEIGKLMCDHQPRDLALMVVRLQGQIEVFEALRSTERHRNARRKGKVP